MEKKAEVGLPLRAPLAQSPPVLSRNAFIWEGKVPNLCIVREREKSVTLCFLFLEPFHTYLVGIPHTIASASFSSSAVMIGKSSLGWACIFSRMSSESVSATFAKWKERWAQSTTRQRICQAYLIQLDLYPLFLQTTLNVFGKSVDMAIQGVKDNVDSGCARHCRLCWSELEKKEKE